MNQIYSQCDDSDHPNEYIVGLCFDKSCLQKPEYCFLCKTEGKHINHQDQCKSFSNLKTILQQTKNKLFSQKEQLLKILQNVSQFLSDVLYQIYQKKLDDCQELISISQDENVEQSKMRIDLFQYYLNLDLEDLRQVLDKVDKICKTFNEDMKKVMDEVKSPIMNQKSVVESQNSNIQNDAKSIQNSNVYEQMNQNSQLNNFQEDNDILQNQINLQEDEDFFQIQMQMIQEDMQNENIQKSLYLTDQAKQSAQNPQIAINMLDEALQLYENNEEAEALKGVILFKQEKYDQSMQSFEKLIQQNSQMPEIYKLYADCLCEKDRLKEADQFYQRAIEINPLDSQTYSNRGNLLIELGKYQEAINCCDKAISLNQQNAPGYNNKAQALKKLKRYQEALVNYDLAHQYNPTSSTILSNKGLLLLQLNKLDEASVCLNQIEQLSEKNIYAFNFKIKFLTKQGKLQEALDTCNQGLLFYPDDQELLKNKQQLQFIVHNIIN